ncbi:MAG TPA: hypothetical protein VHR27_08495, partial [Blastocatellia bacterium]|nr:hypothetical protein [Blastocatellia bacterium]
MSKEMIISVNGREKKIAIVEDDVVTEFYVERGDENQGIVGNIYKGRVMKVLPGMQSAFVDIGLERDSFLYVSDFFDEEEEDVEVEEKREIQRQVQKQPRSQREGLRIAPPPEQELEEDKELELRMAALRHIEEIAEEPELEAVADDEKLEAGLADAANETGAEATLNPRQRRQRRLRYADQEPKAEKVPTKGKVQSVEAEAGVEGQAAETEDEYSGRRRRRPRRRRGAETPEVVEVSEELATEGEEEHPSYIIVHHEPLERITDDDTAVVEGEMLKDAMLQERITERIHEEERRTSLLEVEPTPEVLVGSLHRSIATEPGFERVSDDSEARADVERSAEFYEDVDIETGKIEPISEWTPGVYETFIESYPETPEETESSLTRSDFARPDFAPPDFGPEDETESRAVEPAVEIDEDDRRGHVDAPQNELSTESPYEHATRAPE